MRILAATDSIFRLAAEPWHPEPTPGQYINDAHWQDAHLWNHWLESNESHGPYRGPSILHHPDLQHALDNGWRVIGGDKAIDHQERGEVSSGSPYLYKVSPDGLIHNVHLNTGPSETDNEEESGGLDWGTSPEKNWRHLLMGEGYTSEGPSHNTLRDLVDDEAARSEDPRGYRDFEPLPSYRGDPNFPRMDLDWERKHHNAYRRAWETGTNDPSKHYQDPIPDPYAGIDDLPRARRPASPGSSSGGEEFKHPRYGSVIKQALDYLDQGDVDHSIPSTGHVDDAARWSSEPEVRNQYASEEEHERLRDAGFGRPEDEGGSYMRTHPGSESDRYRIQHAVWPQPSGTWVHVKQDRNQPHPLDYVKTEHPNLSAALREYNKHRNAEPHRYVERD